MRKLDKGWWTSFSFFIAAVAISTATVLYRAKVDENHYGELYRLYITSQLPVPKGKPVPQPTTPGKPADIKI